MGVCSHGKPSVLAAAATTVSAVKDGFVPHMRAAPLLAKVGMDGKEVEGQAACVESNTIVNSWQREDRVVAPF